MPSSTVEDYIKQLYHEQQKTHGGLVPMGRLAEVMGVVPGTVTTMIKALADAGLVDYEPRAGVRLTRGGEQLALHVLRRHRLVELFLVRTLGLDWSEVHPEAEELEHAISDKVLDRIDALLGHPAADPHGDPIPTARGQIPALEARSLADCRVHARFQISRITDQDAQFLQFADRCGLVPGAQGTVTAHDPDADAVVVKCNGRSTTLGAAAAGKILVTLA
jgi:DtxR family Mn-dependent transcriptional regulator